MSETSTKTTKTSTSKPVGELLRELRELVTAYAKQETIEPIKGLGRWLGFGIAGSLLISIGLGLGLLAGLRALQTEVFDVGWTWAPYVVMTGVCGIVIALAVAAASRKGTS